MDVIAHELLLLVVRVLGVVAGALVLLHLNDKIRDWLLRRAGL